MPYGSAASQVSSGENISHFVGLRMRVTGSGNLLMTLKSLDDIHTQVLVPFAMLPATNIQPFRLANFNEQRAYLTLETNEINDYFRISRIIVFAKEVATMYPG